MRPGTAATGTGADGAAGGGGADSAAAGTAAGDTAGDCEPSSSWRSGSSTTSAICAESRDGALCCTGRTAGAPRAWRSTASRTLRSSSSVSDAMWLGTWWPSSRRSCSTALWGRPNSRAIW
ncbi:MAG: hypothetical protein HMLKMBBP_00425 [Planctomycetes bacterium]|nr:hypothetical protein [Planctomycetota bacterium]